MSDDLVSLVEAAFEQARRSGKTEWWIMTAPVLKNRLLQLTDGKFDQSALGFASFTALLNQPELRPLIDVDGSARPPRVTLRDVDATERGDPPRSVRSDLWRAILDYSSGTTWAWNEELGEVTDGEGRPLPTVTESVMAEWRTEFSRHHSSEGSSNSRLAEWRDHGQGASRLSPSLRRAWYEFLKVKVSTRLQAWFISNEIAAPDDLLVTTVLRDPHESDDDLRSYIVGVIGQMTAEELRLVVLPAVTTSRLRGLRP